MALSKFVVGNLNRTSLEPLSFRLEPAVRAVLMDEFGLAEEAPVQVHAEVTDDCRVAMVRVGLPTQKILRVFLFDLGFPILLVDEWNHSYIKISNQSREKLDVAVQQGLDLVCVEMGYTTCMVREVVYPPSERLEELGYSRILELPGDGKKRVLPSIFWREVVEKEKVPELAPEDTGFVETMTVQKDTPFLGFKAGHQKINFAVRHASNDSY